MRKHGLIYVTSRELNDVKLQVYVKAVRKETNYYWHTHVLKDRVFCKLFVCILTGRTLLFDEVTQITAPTFKCQNFHTKCFVPYWLTLKTILRNTKLNLI